MRNSIPLNITCNVLQENAPLTNLGLFASELQSHKIFMPLQMCVMAKTYVLCMCKWRKHLGVPLEWDE